VSTSAIHPAVTRSDNTRVAHARHQVAELLGCDDDEIVFTSGGTEANNLAIRGVAEALENRNHVITTVIEHPATQQPCSWLEQHGRNVTRVAVDGDGRALVDDVRRAISGDTALITVMHSNNETGVLQPIAELAELAHAAGVLMHTDAAQSIVRLKLPHQPGRHVTAAATAPLRQSWPWGSRPSKR
jgi:cysteine desulfurase